MCAHSTRLNIGKDDDAPDPFPPAQIAALASMPPPPPPENKQSHVSPSSPSSPSLLLLHPLPFSANPGSCLVGPGPRFMERLSSYSMVSWFLSTYLRPSYFLRRPPFRNSNFRYLCGHHVCQCQLRLQGRNG